MKMKSCYQEIKGEIKLSPQYKKTDGNVLKNQGSLEHENIKVKMRLNCSFVLKYHIIFWWKMLVLEIITCLYWGGS